MGRFAAGLALSGGTAKCLAHIGVIRALEESGVEVDYLSGTSGGSIVAVLYAAGKSCEELVDLAEGIRWRKLARLTLPRLGLLSGDAIRGFIIDEIGDLDFEDLRIPTAVVAADLTTGKGSLIRDGKVALACQASSSIPEVYSPVVIDGHYLVDGGLVEYLPIEALGSFGEMFKIASHLGLGDVRREHPKHLIEVVMQVTGFVSQQNASISEKKADFIIRPHLAGFSPFALHMASDMIEEGYRAAMKAMPDLNRKLRRYGSSRNRFLRRLKNAVSGFARRGDPKRSGA
jgi:NTE family protein